MKNKKINIIFVVIWLVIIFLMSSFNASESSRQSNFIVSLIMKIFGGNNKHLISIIVRDLAHFIEYFILGILCVNLCKKKKHIYYVLIFCVLYAISDEVHQIFVKGRAFQLLDIIIDSLGSFGGIYLSKGKFDKK